MALLLFLAFFFLLGLALFGELSEKAIAGLIHIGSARSSCGGWWFVNAAFVMLGMAMCDTILLATVHALERGVVVGVATATLVARQPLFGSRFLLLGIEDMGLAAAENVGIHFGIRLLIDGDVDKLLTHWALG